MMVNMNAKLSTYTHACMSTHTLRLCALFLSAQLQKGAQNENWVMNDTIEMTIMSGRFNFKCDTCTNRDNLRKGSSGKKKATSLSITENTRRTDSIDRPVKTICTLLCMCSLFSVLYSTLHGCPRILGLLT